MRAGRLVQLLLLLQARGRMTAGELARTLEVSERTILRDIDELSGAGVPVYPVRGRHGGFELVDSYVSGLAPPPVGMSAGRRSQRARVRITPEGRRLAAVTGRLSSLRVRTADGVDATGRSAASFRIDAAEDAVMDVLALAPHVEVVSPAELRSAVAERARALASLHDTPPHV
jgi:predicted DNA-binding transcriptional regulator YafY